VKRVYISGPMTGLDNFNKAAFESAAEHLKSLGFETVSPHDVIVAEKYKRKDDPWDQFMRADIADIMTCDSVFMIHGWVNSKGAKIERDIASMMGLEILYESNERGFEA